MRYIMITFINGIVNKQYKRHGKQHLRVHSKKFTCQLRRNCTDKECKYRGISDSQRYLKTLADHLNA